MIFFIQILINLLTDYQLFRKENLTVYEIDLRRANEVLELLLFVVLNVYFIYQLQTRIIVQLENEASLEMVSYDDEYLKNLALERNPAFMTAFQQLYPNFESSVVELSPNIILSELEICACLKVNLSTKEISHATNSTLRAIEGKKHRIRKKLNLDKDVDLYLFFSNI